MFETTNQYPLINIAIYLLFGEAVHPDYGRPGHTLEHVFNTPFMASAKGRSKIFTRDSKLPVADCGDLCPPKKTWDPEEKPQRS